MNEMLCKENARQLSEELERGIRNIHFEAPETGTLAEIVAAGAGEHQNRLWTRAIKRSVGKAVNTLFEELEAKHRMHVATCHNHEKENDSDTNPNTLPRPNVTRWAS